MPTTHRAKEEEANGIYRELCHPCILSNALYCRFFLSLRKEISWEVGADVASIMMLMNLCGKILMACIIHEAHVRADSDLNLSVSLFWLKNKVASFVDPQAFQSYDGRQNPEIR